MRAFHSSTKVWPDTKKRDSNGEVSKVVRLPLKKKKSRAVKGYEGLRKQAERRAKALYKKRSRVLHKS